MTTRMVHPKHGATHAYSANEIAQLEKLGWVVEGVTQKADVATFAAEVEAGALAPSATDTYQVIEKRKPGRPPKAK